MMCIYIFDNLKNGTIRLLCAKLCVIFKAINLKLCGILLLAELARDTDITFPCYIPHIMFTIEIYQIDSMITLTWIKDYSNRWKIFIANCKYRLFHEMNGVRKILLTCYCEKCDLSYKTRIFNGTIHIDYCEIVMNDLSSNHCYWNYLRNESQFV